MENMLTIELDVSYEYYNTPEYKFDLIEFLVDDNLIELEGPGGGNPAVEFTGTEQNLRALLAHFGYDGNDIEYYLFGD